MADCILKHASQVMPYADDVRRLADNHRNEFGFLPKNAYDDSATRNNLWVVVEENSRVLQGYLLIGGQHPHMKVFQICVHPDHQSSGIGRMFIRKLIRYSTVRGFLDITARVSSRLKVANEFWRHVGFYVIREEPGKAPETTIRIYSRHLDIPSLFGNDERTLPSVNRATIEIDPRRPMLHTPSYVIDLNVFFDAVRNRDSGQCSQIIASSLRHEIRLFVTEEFVKELDRTSQDRKNDPILTFAKELPTLRQVEKDRLHTIVKDLRNHFSSTSSGQHQWTKNDVSDQTHLAVSIYHKAFGFITSDSAILQRSALLYRRFGLRVVSPTDFVDSFEPDPSTITSVSIWSEKAIQVSKINEQNRLSIDRFLQDHDTHQRDTATWFGMMGAGQALPGIVISSSDQVIGVGLWSGTRGSITDAVLFLFIDEDHPDSDSAIDHILSVSANIRDIGRVWRFNLRIPRRQTRTIDTALKRGFHPQRIDSEDEIEFTRVVIRGPVMSNYWPRVVKEFMDQVGLDISRSMPSYQDPDNSGIEISIDSGRRSWKMSSFEFETFISPGLLITPRREAVIVPIQKRYADELLPEASNQRLLLSRHDAAFRIERAYYLSAGKHALLQRGRLVVFYVSRGLSQAVALARVTYSETLTKTQAMLRLTRQGVLSEDEISHRANDRNEITVFTFDNLVRFPQSIDFNKLKEMECISGANLVTAEKISYVAVRRIVKEAFGANYR